MALREAYNHTRLKDFESHKEEKPVEWQHVYIHVYIGMTWVKQMK